MGKKKLVQTPIKLRCNCIDNDEVRPKFDRNRLILETPSISALIHSPYSVWTTTSMFSLLFSALPEYRATMEHDFEPQLLGRRLLCSLSSYQPHHFGLLRNTVIFQPS